VAITFVLLTLFLEVGRWFINKILNLSGLRIYPPNDPTSLYKNNPLYYGLEALRLEIAMESLGISQANAHCSLVLVAHLYNAAQQERLIQGAWPTLEHAIEANMSPIFSGDLPTTHRQILQRFLLCIKLPITLLARNRNRRSSCVKVSTKNMENVLSRTDISSHLEQCQLRKEDSIAVLSRGYVHLIYRSWYPGLAGAKVM
jgi:hypothetical protein